MPPFTVRCLVGPAGDAGPLNASYDSRDHRLFAQVGLFRDWPKGLNIDALLMFDMQDDGGVDAIEVLQPFGRSVPSGVMRALPNEKFRRLYLQPSASEAGEPDVSLKVEWSGELASLKIDPRDHDAEHLLGPGLHGLTSGDEFVGLRFDFGRLVPLPDRFAP